MTTGHRSAVGRPGSSGPTGGGGLRVRADLRVTVTAPGGRSAGLVVRDDGGVVRVELARAADLAVLRASLPRGAVRPLRAAVRAAVRATGEDTLDQPLDQGVGGAVLLRRRHGRWLLGPRLQASVVGVAAALGALGLVVAARGHVRRR